MVPAWDHCGSPQFIDMPATDFKPLGHLICQEHRFADGPRRFSITEVQNWAPEYDQRRTFYGDGFYFWDETEAHGPYNSSAAAAEAAAAYCEHLKKENNGI